MLDFGLKEATPAVGGVKCRFRCGCLVRYICNYTVKEGNGNSLQGHIIIDVDPIDNENEWPEFITACDWHLKWAHTHRELVRARHLVAKLTTDLFWR
ncbi:MAG TPA: hypothetical protein VNX68_11525, partial [Nitrosopumilaceae archaeon]|nr:hypothetical protein [Nitrosopumilaceae archaeon]